MLSKNIFFTVLITTILSFSAHAQYDFNRNCEDALQALIDLRIPTARQIIKQELEQNPTNYYAYYLDHSCDVYQLVITTSNSDYKVFKNSYELRREIMDEKEADSPYYLFVEAEMQLELGILNIIYGDNFTGLKNAFGAYKKTYKNIHMFPDFMPTTKLIGMFNYSIANLPPFVKWAAATFGVTGDDQTGERLMRAYYAYCKNKPGLNAEAALFNIFGNKLSKEPHKAYEFALTLDSTLINSHKLLQYFKANATYAAGHNEEAISYFSDFDFEAVEAPFPPYYYLMGKIKFRQLDPEAESYLKKYLADVDEMDYIKEINYKLALYYLFQNDESGFREYRNIARDKGSDITERDRESLYDANMEYIPDINLAKGRALLDGGYSERARTYLEKFEADKTTFLPYILEYHLLKGRLAMDTHKMVKAEEEFKTCIRTGADQAYYFAAEAAMYLGQLLESTKPTQALAFYKQARELYQDDYYEYIDVIAQKGIVRLEQ